MIHKKLKNLSDRMRDIIHSPFFLSLTIGIPFCIYKILFGILTTRVGDGNTQYPLMVFGYIIIIWATADLLMNLLRAFQDISEVKDQNEFCTLAQIGRLLKAPLVFLALDTLITFFIICFVLWSGWIIQLTPFESALWYFASTLKLISLSLVGLWTEYRIYKEANIKTDGYE